MENTEVAPTKRRRDLARQHTKHLRKIVATESLCLSIIESPTATREARYLAGAMADYAVRLRAALQLRIDPA